MAEFVFKRAGVRAIIVKQPVGTFLFRESSGDGFAISTVQNSELSGGTEVVSIKLFKKNGGYAVHPKGDVHRSLGVLAQALVTGTMSLDNGQEVRKLQWTRWHKPEGGEVGVSADEENQLSNSSASSPPAPALRTQPPPPLDAGSHVTADDDTVYQFAALPAAVSSGIFGRSVARGVVEKEPSGTFIIRESQHGGLAITSIQEDEKIINVKLYPKDGGYALRPAADAYTSISALVTDIITNPASTESLGAAFKGFSFITWLTPEVFQERILDLENWNEASSPTNDTSRPDRADGGQDRGQESDFVFERAAAQIAIAKEPIGTFLFRKSSGPGIAVSTVQKSGSGSKEVINIKLYSKDGGHAVHPKGRSHSSFDALAEAIMAGAMSPADGLEARELIWSRWHKPDAGQTVVISLTTPDEGALAEEENQYTFPNVPAPASALLKQKKPHRTLSSTSETVSDLRTTMPRSACSSHGQAHPAAAWLASRQRWKQQHQLVTRRGRTPSFPMSQQEAAFLDGVGTGMYRPLRHRDATIAVPCFWDGEQAVQSPVRLVPGMLATFGVDLLTDKQHNQRTVVRRTDHQFGYVELLSSNGRFAVVELLSDFDAIAQHLSSQSANFSLLADPKLMMAIEDDRGVFPRAWLVSAQIVQMFHGTRTLGLKYNACAGIYKCIKEGGVKRQTYPSSSSTKDGICIQKGAEIKIHATYTAGDRDANNQDRLYYRSEDGAGYFLASDEKGKPNFELVEEERHGVRLCEVQMSVRSRENERFRTLWTGLPRDIELEMGLKDSRKMIVQTVTSGKWLVSPAYGPPFVKISEGTKVRFDSAACRKNGCVATAVSPTAGDDFMDSQGAIITWAPDLEHRGQFFRLDNARNEPLFRYTGHPFNCILEASPSYAVGDEIMVYHAKLWTRATVNRVAEPQGLRCSLQLTGKANASEPPIEIDLNGGNHFIAELDQQWYGTDLVAYLRKLCEESAHVTDGLTGKRLAVEDQLVPIALSEVSQAEMGIRASTQHDVFSRVTDVDALIEKMLQPSSMSREQGCMPLAVLIKARAGSGKTWMTRQALHKMAKFALGQLTRGCDRNGVELYVPLLLQLSQFAQMWRASGEVQSTDLIEWYLQNCEDGTVGQQRKLLLDAYRSKRLILIIDGLDEAVDLWHTVRAYFTDDFAFSGNRLLLTSRPEGVQDTPAPTAYASSAESQLAALAHQESGFNWASFATFNLDPFSAAQQQTVFENQLSGRSKQFVQAVMRFTEGRDRMDELHDIILEEAYVEAMELSQIDSFDQTKRADGKSAARYKESMCQVAADSSSGKVRPTQSWDEVKTVGALAKKALDAKLRSFAKKHKLKVITDKKSVKRNMAAIILCPNKKRARGEEKCKLKYQGDCEVGVRPGTRYSWINDVVRVTIVHTLPENMVSLKKDLEDAGFEIVRLKNYFHNLDPTHLRRVAYTVKVSLPNGLHHLCEIQSFHTPTFVFKDIRRDLMHDPYVLFRSLFGTDINNSLGSTTGWMSLTERVKEWASFTSEPVLMSLLITVLDKFDFDNPALQNLPVNRARLYETAITVIVGRKLVHLGDGAREMAMNLIQIMAHGNHFHGDAGRRNFTSVDAVQMIQTDAPFLLRQAQQDLLRGLLQLDSTDANRVPTFKVLDEYVTSSGSVEVNLVIVHLTIQEFLCAQLMAKGSHRSDAFDWKSREAVFKFLQQPRHQKMLDFAAELGIGDTIFNRLNVGTETTLSAVDLSNAEFDDSTGLICANLMRYSTQIKAFSLQDNLVSDVVGIAFADVIRHNSTLLDLNLNGNYIGRDGGVAIGNALAVNAVLQSLDLGSNPLGWEATSAIAKSLEKNEVLQTLVLSGKSTAFTVTPCCGNKGVRKLGDALRMNKTLKHINLKHNDLMPRTIDAFKLQVFQNGHVHVDLSSDLKSSTQLSPEEILEREAVNIQLWRDEREEQRLEAGFLSIAPTGWSDCEC